jgi:NAD+ kinase
MLVTGLKVSVLTEPNQGKISSKIVSTLRAAGVSCEVFEDARQAIRARPNIIVAAGDDKLLLRAFNAMQDRVTPVLGVNLTGETSFLSDVGINDLRKVAQRLPKADYKVDEVSRIQVRIDAKRVPPALNEVAIFPSRSATLLEYSLTVNDEFIWRDQSDGVIIATPTGSTAYAMSAGGPMVSHNAPVFSIVSVNSLDVTRRPFVVSDSSHIRIEEISSRFECEAVIDGFSREKVRDSMEISKTAEPAKIVRLPELSSEMNRMARKLRVAEDLLKMPPSAKLILQTLEYHGPLTQKELIRKSMLPDRTARMALTLLVEKGVVKKKTLLRDARQNLYYASQ